MGTAETSHEKTMMDQHNIRVLGHTNNTKGDLFNSLVKDLFFSLGYEELRENVHKSGREIDIEGVHRLEARRLVAECKAMSTKCGGDLLNKFFGALTRERAVDQAASVVGYFVSLSGFTETAIEQERNTPPDTRMVLLSGFDVVSELTKSGILVDYPTATELAGREIARLQVENLALVGAEVLGHSSGYVWVAYYSEGRSASHYVLVHADGSIVDESLAQIVVEDDSKVGGNLHALTRIARESGEHQRNKLNESSLQKYRDYVAHEYGYIQLDGLPADGELSSKSLTLEKLFVPLKVERFGGQRENEAPDNSPELFGSFFARHRRVALVAKPGAGKSTLIKRLATAYALHKGLQNVDDALPDETFLPLILRCRDLRGRTRQPLKALLSDLSQHAMMSKQEMDAFGESIESALHQGRALLIVDGFDEITQQSDRLAFAKNVRTFLAMFPSAAMVLTSREAGFRTIGRALASICTIATIAPFDREDVVSLTTNWHVELLGDNPDVRENSLALASTIWTSERIRALAENPLMLTTLLVVKRYVGELPTKRVKLYKAAIDVLIRTWNVEGYDPLDEDETLAQLSYIACAMLEAGQAQVSKKQLVTILQNAANELQAELLFAQANPSELIDRIEYRSSLLMRVGVDVFDGVAEPVYEFRHLTFQEYLAARGFVEEQYPGRDEGKTLFEIIEPELPSSSWREVIPLAAVMAGRSADELIAHLTALCAGMRRAVHDNNVRLLRQCIIDEVQVPLPTLKAALRQLARHGDEQQLKGSVSQLLRGKFGTLFKEIAQDQYLEV